MPKPLLKATQVLCALSNCVAFLGVLGAALQVAVLYHMCTRGMVQVYKVVRTGSMRKKYTRNI